MSETFFYSRKKYLRNNVLENLIKAKGSSPEKGTSVHSGILPIILGSQTSLRTVCGPHRPSPFLIWLALAQRSGKGADTWRTFPQWAAKLSSTDCIPFSLKACEHLCETSHIGRLRVLEIIDGVGGLVHTGERRARVRLNTGSVLAAVLGAWALKRMGAGGPVLWELTVW